MFEGWNADWLRTGLGLDLSGSYEPPHPSPRLRGRSRYGAAKARPSPLSEEAVAQGDCVMQARRCARRCLGFAERAARVESAHPCSGGRILTRTGGVLEINLQHSGQTLDTEPNATE